VKLCEFLKKSAFFYTSCCFISLTTFNRLQTVCVFSASLNKAKAMAEKAMDQSDLSEVDALPEKRKRTQTNRFRAGESSSDEEDVNPKLPRLHISSSNVYSFPFVQKCIALDFH